MYKFIQQDNRKYKNKLGVIMKCQVCGKENEITNVFCTNCGSSLNKDLNKKIFKKINFLRIISSLGYLALLIYFIIFYIKDVLFDASSAMAMAFLIGPMILTIIIYLAMIVFLNLIYFNKNIVSNIKVASIMEIIPCAFLLVEEFSNNILIILGLLIFLACPILKLILLKKVSNFNVEEKVRQKNKKCIITFIVSCFCLTGLLYFISLFSSTGTCNKHYDLNDKQINEELKSYTYIGEEVVEESPTGFECRNEDKETYISFKDKYNNDVRLTISDHNKGKVNRYRAIPTIADVQFVNNILKNKKIQIVYNEKIKDYEFIINDSLLEFCIGKDINDEKYNELRKELGMSYSFLKNIDLSKITISNMFEFLDDLNKKYGNSYILKQL